MAPTTRGFDIIAIYIYRRLCMNYIVGSTADYKDPPSVVKTMHAAHKVTTAKDGLANCSKV
jgi:hypothetical protein